MAAGGGKPDESRPRSQTRTAGETVAPRPRPGNGVPDPEPGVNGRPQAPGLDDIRDSRGGQPHGSAGRDPFTVDAPAALAELNATWGTIFFTAYADGTWRAVRIDGTGDVLTGLSPDDLAVQMYADWRGA